MADDRSDWWVICLCAGWCGVCRDWRPLFEQAAREHPHWRFAWVDVEDEADTMGDTDIETFPTVLVARGGEARFLGPIQPSPAQLARLVESLQGRQGPATGLPEGADLLVRRLAAQVLPDATL
jgi:thioredoxin-like negative regulator of GroEL